MFQVNTRCVDHMEVRDRYSQRQRQGAVYWLDTWSLTWSIFLFFFYNQEGTSGASKRFIHQFLHRAAVRKRKLTWRARTEVIVW